MSQAANPSTQGRAQPSGPSAFTPTPEQLAEIQKVNSSVNDDPRWRGKDDFCVPAMAEKMTQLQAAGIPLGAMKPVTVDAGPSYGNEAHSILQIHGANPDGTPWSTFLDINQPHLLTPTDVSLLGYTILE